MKKKKKTLYIRRNSVNLKKKKSLVPYQAESFSVRFNYSFRRKINILKKKSFVRFLNFFESTNFHKAFNFIKYFGMKKSYRLFNFKSNSKKLETPILKLKNNLKRGKKKNYNKVLQSRKIIKKKITKLKAKIKESKFYKKRIAKNSLKIRNKFITSKINKRIRYRKKKRDVEVLKRRFIVFFHQKIKFRSMRIRNIKFKEKLCLYFSYRHMMYLPVRGQRTKTNAKTRKDFYVR